VKKAVGLQPEPAPDSGMSAPRTGSGVEIGKKAGLRFRAGAVFELLQSEDLK